MDFVFLYDAAEWCMHRTALALERYDGRWQSCGVFDRNWRKLNQELPQANVYRAGGVSLFRHFATTTDLFYRGAALFPTVASFADIHPDGEESSNHAREWLESVRSRLAGIVVNDRRLVSHAAFLDIPIIYSPDRVDWQTFHPRRKQRPTSGPLRVGWAGSIAVWDAVKHVDNLQLACKRVGCTFVRQDREKDGWKNASEMCDWYNSLDVYVSPNSEETCTPVPQLESASCGVLNVTTRCGELWPALETFKRPLVMEDASIDSITGALEHLAGMGRERVHEAGFGFLERVGPYLIRWDCGEARSMTQELLRIARRR